MDVTVNTPPMIAAELAESVAQTIGELVCVTDRDYIIAAAGTGKKEAEGPLGKKFDITQNDSYFGEKTWEQAEKRMQQLALRKLAEKAGIKFPELEVRGLCAIAPHKIENKLLTFHFHTCSGTSHKAGRKKIDSFRKHPLQFDRGYLRKRSKRKKVRTATAVFAL